MRLFFGGLKFPRGEIAEGKLQIYVHDVVQFICTRDIMNALIQADQKTFF